MANISYEIFFVALITQEFSKETGNMYQMQWFKVEIHLGCNTWVWQTLQVSAMIYESVRSGSSKITSANAPICSVTIPAPFLNLFYSCFCFNFTPYFLSDCINNRMWDMAGFNHSQAKWQANIHNTYRYMLICLLTLQLSSLYDFNWLCLIWHYWFGCFCFL